MSSLVPRSHSYMSFRFKLERLLGALDQEMTAQSYIVPGIGDAGDLAFGEKL